ncbi:DMT family transporter [Paracoccus ravus]|uniref:DMT family transporter n=1 Tax=Paracoccus ravus TaxID=2447760 RepID=UPI001ADCAFD7|nr:DMT family transporter [Paracoccus ravus]
MARRSTLWADLALLGVALVWGASYPVAKRALTQFPVLLLIFYRFALAAFLMTILAWHDLRAAPPRDLWAGVLLGGILGAIFLPETWGVSMTTVTNTTLIISLCTIFTPFLDYGLQRHLPPAGVTAGAIMAVSGIIVLSGGMGALGAGNLLFSARLACGGQGGNVQTPDGGQPPDLRGTDRCAIRYRHGAGQGAASGPVRAGRLLV